MNMTVESRKGDGRALVIGYGLLGLLTVGYCWLVYLVMGVSMVSVSNMASEVTPITQLAVISSFPVPYHAVVWQSLAVTSLLAVFLWGRTRARQLPPSHRHTCYRSPVR